MYILTQLKLWTGIIYVKDIYQTSLCHRIIIIFDAPKKPLDSCDVYALVTLLNTITSITIHDNFTIKHRIFSKQKCKV